jgi:hypothetical protein
LKIIIPVKFKGFHHRRLNDGKIGDFSMRFSDYQQYQRKLLHLIKEYMLTKGIIEIKRILSKIAGESQ